MSIVITMDQIMNAKASISHLEIQDQQNLLFKILDGKPIILPEEIGFQIPLPEKSNPKPIPSNRRKNALKKIKKVIETQKGKPKRIAAPDGNLYVWDSLA